MFRRLFSRQSDDDLLAQANELVAKAEALRAEQRRQLAELEALAKRLDEAACNGLIQHMELEDLKDQLDR